MAVFSFVQTRNYGAFFGVCNMSYGSYMSLKIMQYSGVNEMRFQYNNGQGTRISSLVIGRTYEVDVSVTELLQQCSVDGVEIVNTETHRELWTEYPIYLFTASDSRYNGGPNTAETSIIQMRSFQIFSDSGQLLFDSIPVVKENEGFMYDRISGQLFGNEGPGEFIIGPQK